MADTVSIENGNRSTGHEVAAGECLKVTIRDNGLGMDTETQKHIFEPFFTTKEPGKGVGMGMASVYGTVKNHHGAIEVEGGPGKGYVPELDSDQSAMAIEKVEIAVEKIERVLK